MLDRTAGSDGGFEDRKGNGRGNLGEFLQNDQGFQIAEAEPAILFRHIDPEEAHLRIALDMLTGRCLVLFLELAGDFRHFLRRKAARRLLQFALLTRQLEIHERSSGLLYYRFS